MPLSPEAEARIVAAKLAVIDRRVNPLLSDLPHWITSFRPHQVQAVTEVVEAFHRVPVVVLDAPTGSGKTLIAETVRRMLRTSAVYMCTTKGLQDQFVKDYPYASVLKGRRNYPTQRFPNSFHPDEYNGHLSCDDCTWRQERPECRWCERKSRCPYIIAKSQALSSMLAVLNTAYFLTAANRAHSFTDSRLVIADEADTLEQQLMGFVSVEISPRRMEKYGWMPPKKVTVVESWKEWLDETIPNVERQRRLLPSQSTELRNIREAKYLDSLRENLRSIRSTIDAGYWVYTGRDNRVSFRPSRVDTMGQEFLWTHSERWLLMSATVISSQELLESLGYTGQYEVVRVPSTFPVENRRVTIWPVANMSKKAQENGDSKERVVDAINAILARHTGERVLLHCVSYDLARTISAGIRSSDRRIYTYTSADERNRALDAFCGEGGKSGVLVAPSMDRGVDLPDDLCRVQIVAKIPYPNLGDRQVNARKWSRGGNVWYMVQTIRTLVQMCGRGVRSSTDYCTTYILDAQFGNGLWSRGRGMFPQWFKDALVWQR